MFPQPQRVDRRRSANRKMEYKEIRNHHHEILRLSALGLKQTEIAKALNVTPTTVCNIVNSKLHIGKLEELQEERDKSAVDIMERIQSMCVPALDVLEGIVKGEVDGEKVKVGLRQKTATEVLAMGGYGKITKLESKNLHLTSDDIASLRERAKQIEAEV